jgi:MATE family multidrug resistance protein
VAPALAKAAIFTGSTALCETGVYLSSTVVVAFVAIEAVPAHILVFRTVAVTYVIGTGFAQAVTIHLARQIETGAGAIHLTRASLLGTGTLASTFLGAMLALPLSSSLTGIDGILLADLAPWGAVAVCNLVPAVVAFGILRARADVAVPSLISLAGYWGIGFGLIVLLSGPLGYGVVGVWTGLSIGTTATAAGLWLYLRRRSPRASAVQRPL